MSYNQEIVWDLFDNYARAADVLGIDREYRDKIAAMRDKLSVPVRRQLGAIAGMANREDQFQRTGYAQ